MLSVNWFDFSHRSCFSLYVLYCRQLRILLNYAESSGQSFQCILGQIFSISNLVINTSSIILFLSESIKTFDWNLNQFYLCDAF